jgi:hypothetical protein
MPIIYGTQRDSVSFSNPVQLKFWTPPKLSGLYAILIPDNNQTPLPFNVIYFGEAKDFSARGFSGSHHKYRDWHIHTPAGRELFVAICLMPYATDQHRQDVERQLIEAYAPICNEKGVLAVKPPPLPYRL